MTSTPWNEIGSDFLSLDDIRSRYNDLRDVAMDVAGLDPDSDVSLTDILEADSTLADRAGLDGDDIKFARDIDNADVAGISNFLDEGNGLDDMLIHEGAFVEYAKELADDLIGAPDHSWPMCHIDWDAAADSLKSDYAEVTIGYHVYLVR